MWTCSIPVSQLVHGSGGLIEPVPGSRALAGVKGVVVASSTNPRRRRMGRLSTEASTCSQRIAMQSMGHSKIAVTMEIYTHVPSDLTRTALHRLGDQFEGLW
jgi:hypothetical protein